MEELLSCGQWVYQAEEMTLRTIESSSGVHFFDIMVLVDGGSWEDISLEILEYE